MPKLFPVNQCQAFRNLQNPAAIVSDCTEGNLDSACINNSEMMFKSTLTQP